MLRTSQETEFPSRVSKGELWLVDIDPFIFPSSSISALWLTVAKKAIITSSVLIFRVRVLLRVSFSVLVHNISGILGRFILHTSFLVNITFIAGPREARNPNLDSDQRIASYACAPMVRATFITFSSPEPTILLACGRNREALGATISGMRHRWRLR